MPGHKDWLIKATSDLKLARKGMRGDDDTLDGVAFLTHQCIEKALKAYLVFRRAGIKKTHDLELLVELCAIFDYDFNGIMRDIENVNPYAVYSRYPDDRFFIDCKEALQAIKCAAKVLRFVTKKIENPDPNLRLF